MNPKSVLKTLPGERTTHHATLIGFQRKINAPVNGYLYLNLVPRAGKKVDGVLISITIEELEYLKKREPGYECVDVSSSVEKKIDGTVYTFIAPHISHPKLRVPRSYLKTCLSIIPDVQKTRWLDETIIENEIAEDLNAPVYANVALE